MPTSQQPRRTLPLPTTPTTHCRWAMSSPSRCEIDNGRDRCLPRARSRRLTRSRSAWRSWPARAPRITVLRRHPWRRAERRPDLLGTKRRRSCKMSDKPTESSPLDQEISRRELLRKAGQVGVGPIVGGTLVGRCGSESKRVRRSRQESADRRHGHVGPRAGPGCHRTVRRHADDQPHRQRADVRLAARVGPEAATSGPLSPRATTSSTRSGSSGSCGKASSSTTARS